MDLRALAAQKANELGVSPDFVRRVIHQESRWNPAATSPVGAIGLMQVMPGTGRDLGVANPQQLYDPLVNINAGVRYLRDLLGRFKDEGLAAAAYNAGPGRVGKLLRKHGPTLGNIYSYLPKETRGYVGKVLGQDYTPARLPVGESIPISVPVPVVPVTPSYSYASSSPSPTGGDALNWVMSNLLSSPREDQDPLSSLFARSNQIGSSLGDIFLSRML